MYEIQQKLKLDILNTFNENDFNLDSLNVCTTEYNKFKFKKNFSKIDNLNDAIDCCIASSHLPIFSNGKLFYKYKDKLYVDGGFKYPTPLGIKSWNINFSPNMFVNNKGKIYNYNNINNLNIEKLIECGYNDAENNLNF